MAYKIHINMISVRHLLTLGLVTLVMTYQFCAVHTAAMLDYECLNWCWLNAHYSRLKYCCRKHGDGYLNQVSILKNQNLMANLRFTLSYYMAAMLVFGGRWEYFTILYEILTDENVGIDTQNKSVDGLIRKIFVIE